MWYLKWDEIEIVNLKLYILNHVQHAYPVFVLFLLSQRGNIVVLLLFHWLRWLYPWVRAGVGLNVAEAIGSPAMPRSRRPPLFR